MRRVVLVHSSDEMYGADRIVLQITDALRAEPRLALEVWLPTDVQHGATPLCAELEERGVTVRHMALPMLRRSLLTPSGLVAVARRCRALRRSLVRHRADLVYCTTSACAPVVAVAKSAGVASIVLHAQEIWSGPERRLLRLMVRGSSLRIAISSAVDRSMGLDDPRPVIVPNAVPAPAVAGPPLSPDGRPDGLRFVVASRWTPRKGYATLLEAWSLAGCPGHLTILGGPAPAGRSVDVPHLVSTLVSQIHTVSVVGEVPDIAPYIAESDVVLLPSDLPEGFGLVVVEAFAQGRPAVASRSGGTVDVVTHGVDGWLFTPGDPVSLAAVLSSLTPAAVAEAGARSSRAAARHTPDRFQRTIRSLILDELGMAQPAEVDVVEQAEQTEQLDQVELLSEAS